MHLVGRGATCIITGGEKVYPEEVEAVLLTHPRVRDAIVVGIPDEHYGAAVAAVVACDGAPVELDELRAHCRSALAGYKLPRAVTVVDTVQRSPAGKPDHAWAGAAYDQTMAAREAEADAFYADLAPADVSPERAAIMRSAFAGIFASSSPPIAFSSSVRLTARR